MTHKFAICLYMPDMPQNVGVIIRTAACLEFPLHIIKPLSFSMTDKRFKGAVMDYINYCDLKLHNGWEDFMVYCQNGNKRLILQQLKLNRVSMIIILNMMTLYYLVKKLQEYRIQFIKP